jgi:hypothetical protein
MGFIGIPAYSGIKPTSSDNPNGAGLAMAAKKRVVALPGNILEGWVVPTLHLSGK